MFTVKKHRFNRYLSLLLYTGLVSACVDVDKPKQQRESVGAKIINPLSKKKIRTFSSYEKRIDGAFRVTDCKGHSSCQNAVFSEDGTEILFTRFVKGYNEGPSEIIRLNLSTLEEIKVIPASEYDHVNVPGSSWKNGIFTYASDHSETEHEEIFVSDPLGKNIKQITFHTDDSVYFEPSFSVNSQKIVFEKSGCSSKYSTKQCERYDLGRGSVWLIDIATSRLSALISDNEMDYRLPNWSPRGDKILFQQRKYPSQTREEPDWDIWTVSVDGSNKKNITQTHEWHETDASWSSDGEYIVYSSDYGDIEQPNIFVIATVGGIPPKRMTYSPKNEDGAPSFSPDSKFIVFESHKTEDEDSPSNIWVIKSAYRDISTQVSTYVKII